MKVQAKVMKEKWDSNWNQFNLTTRGNNKPSKAIWTSTFSPHYNEIEWIEWCNWNEPEWINGNLYKIYPKDNLKVYEINTVEDYLSDELVKSVYDVYLMNSYINYQAMADKGYDGIHFTSNAAILGHSFMGDIPRDISFALNPIDCESTVWFNTDWVDHVELVTSNIEKEIEEEY